MGTTEAIKITPVPLGSYSADAVVGKAAGLSPDSFNIRHDVFGNIKSILGNSPYFATQVGGAYNLGGNVYQYIRKDGTFDIVLSRKKAEGKIYKVVGAGASQNNLLNTSGAWNSGTPTNGDNLLDTTSDTLKQLNQHLKTQWDAGTLSNVVTADNSVTAGSEVWASEPNYTAYDIELGSSSEKYAQEITFTGDTRQIKLGIAKNTAFTGTVNLRIETNNAGEPSGTLLDANATASIAVSSLSVGTGGVALFTLAANITGAGGLYWIVISCAEATSSNKIIWGRKSPKTYTYGYNYYNGSVWTPGFGIGEAFRFYLFKVNTIILPAIDYGRTPTTLGNLTATVTLPTGTSIETFIATSADNITYSAYTSLGSYTASESLSGITPARYVKLKAQLFVSVSNVSPTLVNLVIGAEWVSVVQDLGGTPIAWGDVTLTVVNTNSGTLTVAIDTSADGTTWDGYTAVTSGSAFTGTKRQFIRWKVILNIDNITKYVEVDSLNLVYYAAAVSGSLTELTGYTGTGWDQYFGVLNNLLIISDGTTYPYSWSGTGAALTAITGGPSGTYPETHYGRYFLAYSSANPSRVWWSDAEDPATWDLATQFIDVNPDDGDQITGIKSYGGVLYVFKHRHAYLIQGNDFDPTVGNFSLQSMPQVPGTESHNSIVIGSDGNMYWYGIKGISQYNGSSVPTGIGKGFIDDTIKTFNQNLASYNIINAVDFIAYDEIWFAFGHTIYSYNYTTGKWNRILFDNNTSGFSVYSLAQYKDRFTTNILSFTGNNVIEQWNNTATFYIGSIASPYTLAIHSRYVTDFLDGEWYFTKNTYKALLNIYPLTATSITVSNYIDYSTTALGTTTVTCPTISSPDQYRRVDLVSIPGKRMQIRISCSSLQFGLSDLSIQEEVVGGGRL